MPTASAGTPRRTPRPSSPPAADRVRTAAAVDGEEYRTSARQEAKRLVETARSEAARVTEAARQEVESLTGRRDAVTRELTELTASMNELGASMPRDLLALTDHGSPAPEPPASSAAPAPVETSAAPAASSASAAADPPADISEAAATAPDGQKSS